MPNPRTRKTNNRGFRGYAATSGTPFLPVKVPKLLAALVHNSDLALQSCWSYKPRRIFGKHGATKKHLTIWSRHHGAVWNRLWIKETYRKIRIGDHSWWFKLFTRNVRIVNQINGFVFTRHGGDPSQLTGEMIEILSSQWDSKQKQYGWSFCQFPLPIWVVWWLSQPW